MQVLPPCVLFAQMIYHVESNAFYQHLAARVGGKAADKGKVRRCRSTLDALSDGRSLPCLMAALPECLRRATFACSVRILLGPARRLQCGHDAVHDWSISYAWASGPHRWREQRDRSCHELWRERVRRTVQPQDSECLIAQRRTPVFPGVHVALHENHCLYSNVSSLRPT